MFKHISKKQRNTINAYQNLARSESFKNFNDPVRDAKSLIVPYLFSQAGKTPDNCGGLGEYSKLMAKANKFIVDYITLNFQPNTEIRTRGRKLTPFNTQLLYWWNKNKSQILENTMKGIKQNAQNIFNDAIGYNQNKTAFQIKRDNFNEQYNKAYGRHVKGEIEMEDLSSTSSSIISNTVPPTTTPTSTSSSSSAIQPPPMLNIPNPYSTIGRGGGAFHDSAFRGKRKRGGGGGGIVGGGGRGGGSGGSGTPSF